MVFAVSLNVRGGIASYCGVHEHSCDVHTTGHKVDMGSYTLDPAKQEWAVWAVQA